jgi:hypothetical protein
LARSARNGPEAKAWKLSSEGQVVDDHDAVGGAEAEVYEHAADGDLGDDRFVFAEEVVGVAGEPPQ